MNENTIPHTVEHLLQLLQTITRTEHLSFTVEQDRLMIPDFGTSFNIINLDAYSTGEIHHRLQQSRLNMDRSNTDSIPLLCVPFMKEAGKIICQEEQMSWFDLSGNAHITTNTLHIFIEGKANKYPDIGRPSNKGCRRRNCPRPAQCPRNIRSPGHRRRSRRLQSPPGNRWQCQRIRQLLNRRR